MMRIPLYGNKTDIARLAKYRYTSRSGYGPNILYSIHFSPTIAAYYRVSVGAGGWEWGMMHVRTILANR